MARRDQRLQQQHECALAAEFVSRLIQVRNPNRVLLAAYACRCRCPRRPPRRGSLTRPGSVGSAASLLRLTIPIGSIPIGSIPIGSIPIGSLPIGSIPIGSLPIGFVADLAQKTKGLSLTQNQHVTQPTVVRLDRLALPTISPLPLDPLHPPLACQLANDGICISASLCLRRPLTAYGQRAAGSRGRAT